MNDERKNAERRFWQSIFKMAAGSGFEPVWENMGYSVDFKKIKELVTRFHNEPGTPGFFGIRIQVGHIRGVKLNLLVENQTDLIVGIQSEENEDVPGDFSIGSLRDIMIDLVNTRRNWNFEAPGWIAWKSPDIRLNFRSPDNKAFRDMTDNKWNSEALYLITGEIADILEEMREIIEKENTVVYGTVAI